MFHNHIAQLAILLVISYCSYFGGSAAFMVHDSFAEKHADPVASVSQPVLGSLACRGTFVDTDKSHKFIIIIIIIL